MDIHDLISLMKRRKSIRSFFPGKMISDEELGLLLEAGRLAPSAGNMQSWHFFIVRDREKKKSLGRAAFGQSFIDQAPLVIVVAIDLERAQKGYGKRGVGLYGIQETAAAIEHMLLAARVLDIGSCWIGAFSEEECGKVCGLDRTKYRPVAILPFGYSDEDPADRGRIPVREITTEL